MVRLLARISLELLANAVGLLVAALALDNFSISATAFVIVVAIYSVIKFVLGPLVVKLAFTHLEAFRGGIALITTIVGLMLTAILSDGLQVSGISTWIAATLIVWLFGVFASLLLPLIIFKGILNNSEEPRKTSR